jgi:hypothetical protein
MKFPSPKAPSASITASLALDAVLVLGEARPTNPGSDDDASLLALVDGRRTVAEILRVSRLSGSVAMRRLRSLSDRRIVRTVATRLASPSVRITNPRMGATQDLSATADAFLNTAPTAKRNEGARPSSPTPPRAYAPPAARPPVPPAARVSPPIARPASPTPRRVPQMPAARPRSTPAMASSAPVATSVAMDPDLIDFNNLPETPPPEPLRPVTPATPRQPERPRTGALVPRTTSRTEIIERPISLPSRDYVAAGELASQMQDLWFRLARNEWATLALVPADATGSALSVACGLVDVGAAFTGKAIDLLSAEGRELEPEDEWIFPRKKDERFARVIALEPLSSNPRGIAVAKAADAVVLVVEAGTADLASARRTVEKIGRQHVLGCVMLPPR